MRWTSSSSSRRRRRPLFDAGRAGALGLSRERRGRRRDARCQPHRLREVQHPRPAPDRCAQDRHEREDLRRDVGQPHLLLPGQQPRRLQPGGGGRRGARRRQAQAPDDPLHGRQREHRRREQGARLARLVHAVPNRRLERDAGAGEACRERRLPGHRPHRRPTGRPQHGGHVSRRGASTSATAPRATSRARSPTRSSARPTSTASTSPRSQTSTAPA